MTPLSARIARGHKDIEPATSREGQRRRTVYSLLAIAATLFACAGSRVAPIATSENLTQANRLQVDLERLAPDADPEEARALATAIVSAATDLAAEYRMVRPALLNNVFINLGLKKRGLCWHWAKDLLATLRQVRLVDYELHWGTAHPGRLFREHNSLVVTARGAPFASGLVLDPWRDSGNLYWISVSEDHYPWQAHRAAAPRAPGQPSVDATAARG